MRRAGLLREGAGLLGKGGTGTIGIGRGAEFRMYGERAWIWAQADITANIIMLAQHLTLPPTPHTHTHTNAHTHHTPMLTHIPHKRSHIHTG